MFSDTSISPNLRCNNPRESTTAVAGSAFSNTPAFQPAAPPNNSISHSNLLDSPSQPNQKTQQLLVSIEDIQCFSQTMKVISAKQIPIVNEFQGDPQKLVNILTAQIFTLVEQVHNLSDKLEESIIGQQCLSEKFLHLRSNYYRMLTRSTSTSNSSKSQQYFSQGSSQQNVLNSSTDNTFIHGSTQSHDENAQPEGIRHTANNYITDAVCPQLSKQANPSCYGQAGIDSNNELRNHTSEGANQHEKQASGFDRNYDYQRYQEMQSQRHSKLEEHNVQDKSKQPEQSQPIANSFPREIMSMESRLEDIRREQALVQQTLKDSNLRANQQQQQQSVQSSLSIHKESSKKQDQQIDSRLLKPCASSVSIENNPSQKLFGTQQTDLPYQFSGLIYPK